MTWLDLRAELADEFNAFHADGADHQFVIQISKLEALRKDARNEHDRAVRHADRVLRGKWRCPPASMPHACDACRRRFATAVAVTAHRWHCKAHPTR